MCQKKKGRNFSFILALVLLLSNHIHLVYIVVSRIDSIHLFYNISSVFFFLFWLDGGHISRVEHASLRCHKMDSAYGILHHFQFPPNENVAVTNLKLSRFFFFFQLDIMPNTIEIRSTFFLTRLFHAI